VETAKSASQARLKTPPDARSADHAARAFLLNGDIMPVTASHPREQISDALRYVRNARHHPECHCGTYQRLWCTPEEKLWCTAVDRLLTTIATMKRG